MKKTTIGTAKYASLAIMWGKIVSFWPWLGKGWNVVWFSLVIVAIILITLLLVKYYWVPHMEMRKVKSQEKGAAKALRKEEAYQARKEAKKTRKLEKKSLPEVINDVAETVEKIAENVD